MPALVQGTGAAVGQKHGEMRDGAAKLRFVPYLMRFLLVLSELFCIFARLNMNNVIPYENE